MKILFFVLISVFALNVYAEYKPEEISPSQSYTVDFESDNKEDKSRNVAAKPTKSPAPENYKEEEEVEPSRELVPFWDFKKEKF